MSEVKNFQNYDIISENMLREGREGKMELS